MVCPKCNTESDNRVYCCKNGKDGAFIRYRKCRTCGQNFKTEERAYSEKEVLQVKSNSIKRRLNANKR